MAQQNTFNVKLSNSQLNKLKSGIKVTLKISSNVVGDSNDKNNFPHKLLLTNTQFLICILCICFDDHGYCKIF